MNYEFDPNSYKWQAFNGGVVPDGYECQLFVHCGLMIRKKRDMSKFETNDDALG
jgi:hypothetical protein